MRVCCNRLIFIVVVVALISTACTKEEKEQNREVKTFRGLNFCAGRKERRLPFPPLDFHHIFFPSPAIYFSITPRGKPPRSLFPKPKKKMRRRAAAFFFFFLYFPKLIFSWSFGEGIPLIGMQQRTCCKPLARIDLSRLQALGLPWGVRGGWEIPPQGGRGGDHEVVLPRTPCTKRYSLFPYFLF